MGCRGRLRDPREERGTVLPPALTRDTRLEWRGLRCEPLAGSVGLCFASGSRVLPQLQPLVPVLSAPPAPPLSSHTPAHSDPRPATRWRPRPPFPLASAVREGANPGRHTESKGGECDRGGPRGSGFLNARSCGGSAWCATCGAVRAGPRSGSRQGGRLGAPGEAKLWEGVRAWGGEGTEEGLEGVAT